MTNQESPATGNYFVESVQELKKVTWPTRNQAFRMTLIVLGFCLAMAVLIGAVDLLLNSGFKFLLSISQTV